MKKNCCEEENYPEFDNYISDKVEIDLSNYATKKEIRHAPGIDTSNLAA